MKMILTTGRAGNGIVQNKGDEVDVSDEEAAAMMASGGGVPATKASKVKVERAVAPPAPERAVVDPPVASPAETLADRAG